MNEPNLKKKTQPYETQIREFWEWCGLRLVDPHTHPLGQAGNILQLNQEYGFPAIDLNNLFLYAKPAVIKKLGKAVWEGILLKWFKEMMIGKDPARALFWAIYELIKTP